MEEPMTWREAEKQRLRAKIFAAPLKGGVRRWPSTGRAIPPHVYRDAGLEAPEAQTAAYEEETAAFLREYREAQADRSPEERAEQEAEARAAHGPGVTLVNVITGEKVTT